MPRVIVTDPMAVCLQTIIDSLALWQGEWFLDMNAGFPWAQRVFGVVPANPTAVGALIRQQLLAIKGIVSVTAKAKYNSSTRAFSYTFTAVCNAGQVITGGSGQPLQVTGSP